MADTFTPGLLMKCTRKQQGINIATGGPFNVSAIYKPAYVFVEQKDARLFFREGGTGIVFSVTDSMQGFFIPYTVTLPKSHRERYVLIKDDRTDKSEAEVVGSCMKDVTFSFHWAFGKLYIHRKVEEPF